MVTYIFPVPVFAANVYGNTHITCISHLKLYTFMLSYFHSRLCTGNIFSTLLSLFSTLSPFLELPNKIFKKIENKIKERRGLSNSTLCSMFALYADDKVLGSASSMTPPTLLVVISENISRSDPWVTLGMVPKQRKMYFSSTESFGLVYYIM